MTDYKQEVKVGDVEPGTFFKLNGKLYLKVHDICAPCNAVEINLDNIGLMSNTMAVEPVTNPLYELFIKGE